VLRFAVYYTWVLRSDQAAGELMHDDLTNSDPQHDPTSSSQYTMMGLHSCELLGIESTLLQIRSLRLPMNHIEHWLRVEPPGRRTADCPLGVLGLLVVNDNELLAGVRRGGLGHELRVAASLHRHEPEDGLEVISCRRRRPL